LRLIGYSIIVAMILMIIASAASATQTTSSVGGVAAVAASGAGYGEAMGEFFTNDDDPNIPFLSADVWAEGFVDQGTTGTFAASYDTGGAKSKSFGTLTGTGYSLKTTVNGKPAVAISKTSTAGSAYAFAELYAYATGDIAGYYAEGEATAYAEASLTGVGSVSASAPATEVSYDAIVSPVLEPYVISEAIGNVKNTAVTIAGTVDDPNDNIYGYGEVGSYSWADEDGGVAVGTYADVWEDFYLQARKQISFDGPTKITATVTGEEFAEPVAYWLTFQPEPEAMSDVEATSKLSGIASVYKKSDYASSYADFWAEARSYPSTGDLYADEGMYLYGYASRLLADSNAQNAARGTAKVDSATWSAAALADYQEIGQVGVEGETGFTENGGGIMLSGVGVGAATKGANVVYAAIEQGEESDFYTGLDEWVRVTLQAPQYSGTDTGGRSLCRFSQFEYVPNGSRLLVSIPIPNSFNRSNLDQDD
jgi:hypothetical protein